MIYRDDDINVHTCVEELRFVNASFEAYQGKIHTIACEMKDIWENKGLWYYIVSNPIISVELHGWHHVDYSKMSEAEVYIELKRALDYWETHSAPYPERKELAHLKTITTFFPPWNRNSREIEAACKRLGLRVDARGSVPGEVFAFHYWCLDLKDLENHFK